MKTIFIINLLILSINALSEINHWTRFKETHGKEYKNFLEDKMRFQIFKENLDMIREHNDRYAAGLETYYMKINKFADLTSSEFSALLKQQKSTRPEIRTAKHIQNGTAPGSIDWREKNAVLGVKDQGGCGSCWAFSATGAMEGQNAIINKVKISLSEQDLLDCSGSYGNGNCEEGGDMVNAFRYVMENGIRSEDSYPYTSKQGECKKSENSVLQVKNFVEIEKTEEALKNAVGTVGPISVAIYGEPIQHYGGGILHRDDCYNSEEYLNHGVLVVGYGEDPKPYWIIKNSWGSDWGEEGYLRLSRNANQCGIALDTSYPIL